MKKNLLSLLILTTVALHAQFVSIPNANFRSALKAIIPNAFNIDNLLDTTSSLVTGTTNLNVSNSNISSLEGIQYFKGLLRLDCYSNQLTSLDLRRNSNLRILYCYSNELTALNVSKNTALTGLFCYSNLLTNLDLSQNIALRGLECDFNNITSLDVSNNVELTQLSCSSNQLLSLDLLGLSKLTYLKADGNCFTTPPANPFPATLTSFVVTPNRANCTNSLEENDYSLEKVVSFAPNPVQTTVYFPTPQTGQLLDAFGNVVASFTNASSLLMQNYPQGMYFIKLESSKLEKVLKQ